MSDDVCFFIAESLSVTWHVMKNLATSVLCLLPFRMNGSEAN